MTTPRQSNQTQGNDARNEDRDIEEQCPSKVVEFLTKKKLKPLVRLFLPRYRQIFVFFRALAVSLDPLFFYVPVIKEDKKCIGLNNVVWTIAVVSRSVIDVVFLVHFVVEYMIRRDELKKDRRRLRFIMLNVLAILPIPQVVILTIFLEMRSTKSSNKVQLLNSIVLFQYVPRVSQIYLSCERLIRNYGKLERIILVKVSLKFMLYVLAAYALGAFWYFFSTQRLAACWHIACENHSECVGSSFNCDHNFKNISFIDDICPINIANTTSFNFGIFLEALQSGVLLESTDFPRKLLYSFWWGVRNLSSLGSNLQTSNYIWEYCFAFSISIFGLILMMGNVQVYLEWGTTKEQKWRKLQKSLKMWMDKYNFDRTTRDKIIDDMAKIYEADEDVHVETLIPDLRPELQSAVKRHICLNLLKNLKIIKDTGLAKHDSLLLKICDSLHPMFYDKYCYIVREGDPIDAVLFITEGTVWTYTSNNGEGSDSRHAERLEKGQCFGGELLELVLGSTSDDMSNLSKVKVSSKTLKTYTKVEAFALMAHDLRQIWQSKRIDLRPGVLGSFTCTMNLVPQSPEDV